MSHAAPLPTAGRAGHSAGTRTATRAGCLALALLLGGCGAFGIGDDGAPEPAELTQFAAELEVDVAWRRSVGAGVDEQYLALAPVLDGDTLYAAGANGRVSALDAASGDERWRTDLDLALSGGPGVGVAWYWSARGRARSSPSTRPAAKSAGALA